MCRFLWTVQYLVGAGFYVIPAYQPADNSADNTVCSVPGIFQRNWANLWAAITDLPVYSTSLKGRILLDLLSEPDQFGFRWESSALRKGFQYPDLTSLYGNTMNVRANHVLLHSAMITWSGGSMMTYLPRAARHTAVIAMCHTMLINALAWKLHCSRLAFLRALPLPALKRLWLSDCDQ